MTNQIDDRQSDEGRQLFECIKNNDSLQLINLIYQGININMEIDGISALQYAINLENISMVSSLILLEAETIQSSRAISAADYARDLGQHDLARIIEIASTARKWAKWWQTFSELDDYFLSDLEMIATQCLLNSVANNDLDGVKEALEEGALLHLNINGMTALKQAILNGNKSIVRMLIMAGAAISVPNQTDTAADYANYIYQPEIAEIINNFTTDNLAEYHENYLNWRKHQLDVRRVNSESGIDSDLYNID